MKILSLLRFTKVFSILSLGGAFKEVKAIRSVVFQIAVVFALTAASAMLAGATFLFILYGIYRAFVYFGVESDYAILFTGLITATIAGILIAYTVKSVKKLMKLTKQMQQTGSPVVNKARNIANSFLDGLTTQSERQKTAYYDEKRKYYS